MDKKIEMVAEIKHLIENSIAEGGDSWFAGAELDITSPVDPQRDEIGLGARFRDGKTYAITIKQIDDAIV